MRENNFQKNIGLFLTVISIFIFLSIFQQAYTQTMNSPLAADGGPDCHLYKTDTVMLENTVLDDGSGIAPARSFTTGLHQFHSPYLKFFYIPLIYSITDNFAVNLTLPLMQKMLVDGMNDVSKIAFGDIKIGVTSSFSFVNDTVILSTHLKSTIPTGDNNAISGSIMVPLGYGNFTFSLLQSLSVKAPEIYTRFFINAGGILFLPTEYVYSAMATYMVDLGYAMSSLVGFEITYFKDISLSVRFNFVYLAERTYKEKNGLAGTISSTYDANDMMITSDIIPSLTYTFSNDIKGTLTFIFPIWTKEDTDLLYKADRDWKIYLGIEKVFSISTKDTKTPSNTTSITKKKKKKKKKKITP